MCKKLPYSEFYFVDISYFDEDFIKNYDEDENDYGFVFVMIMLNILKK